MADGDRPAHLRGRVRGGKRGGVQVEADSASLPLTPELGAEPTDRIRLQPRGSSQGGLRQYNERIVLQSIRLHGPLAGAEIARRTRLTAQTVSQISRHLLQDGLVIKGAPLRGKVGQPSVPLSLNPDGAFAVGIKVGRRNLDVLLVDFTGALRDRWTLAYRFPEPEAIFAAIGKRFATLRRQLGADKGARVQGVGIAAPLAIGGWQPLLGFDPALSAAWSRVDLRAGVARLTDWPVTVMKDTAAACVAELVAGRGRSVAGFLYVFVDTFVGGGLVLGSQLHAGATGNAGAVGSMPLAMARAGAGKAPPQLLSVASLHSLEAAWAAAGLDDTAADNARALQPPWRPHTLKWLDKAGATLAQAISSGACLLDLDAAIVDGAVDRSVLTALLQATEGALDRYSWEGVMRPRLLTGTIGADAQALGGALLPLYANFAPDRELFLKAAA